MSLQLAFSDYVAVAAFVISVATFFYTKQQAEAARIGTRNDARGRLAEHHKEFKAALKDINEKHRSQIQSLSNRASDALYLALNEFDTLDLRPGTIPYLRHSAGECAEMIYYSFKGQLGRQSALNITHRFYAMTRLSTDLNRGYSHPEPSDLRREFERAYFADPNRYQEQALLTNSRFIGPLHSLAQRISQDTGGELLLRIQSHMQEFNEELKTVRAAVEPSVERLANLLDEGKDDEYFPLDESPTLFSRLYRTHVSLDTLCHLTLPHVNKENAHKHANFLNVAIYQCALLYAVQDFHDWGWERG